MRLSIGLVSSLLVATVAAAVENSGLYKRQNDSNSGYAPKKGPLDTPWTDKVGIHPWPEYPRSQLARSDWKNLNGVWQYQNASGGSAELSTPPFGKELELPVLVPFCLESALSGIMRNHTYYSWYRTTFDVPSSWDAKKRVLLNFGAVDYESTVFVNGKNLFHHVGGYFSFAVDVTDHLNANGTNELIVFVYDPTNLDGTNIPLGKQRLNPDHINYTPCSGIWQTVWLESAPVEHITRLDIDANMHGKVNVTVHTSSNSSTEYEITVFSKKAKAQATGKANAPFIFAVADPELWSPDSPTLYNITIKLGNDTVQSYTGFRTISVGELDGVKRPLLNGDFIFQFGTLDQGYWPDGLHSPPSLEAMVFDLEVLKEVGYNMVRKHIKIEPALFYRACDELGLLVIQDMPSLPTYFFKEEQPKIQYLNTATEVLQVPEDAQKTFEAQLALLINQLKSAPSIVSWVIYNEGWGQETKTDYPEFRLTDMVKSLDPTRLVNAVTGWHDHGAGDFHDNHHYPYPQCGTPFYSIQSTPYDPKRIGIQGEFGGIGLNVTEEHAWKVAHSIHGVNQTYELSSTNEIWNFRAHELLTQLRGQIERFACSVAVWTQTTDVEGEVNGMLTYDRRVNRMDKEQWKKDIQGLYDAAAKRATNHTTSMMERNEWGM